ncbi:hypothetical protein OUZ56_001910 [Daphnia magna]|uniref:Uncharacterized protein n=1 Tax=Daphnia magna TaxID=35525 RepID=A0ABR0A434_9CRUS|nr:hypothetical protein OUZ56_001910 [Daphnia magna]
MKWNRYLPQFLRGRRQLTRHLAIATSIIVEIFSSSSQPDTSASERFLGRMSWFVACLLQDERVWSMQLPVLTYEINKAKNQSVSLCLGRRCIIEVSEPSFSVLEGDAVELV